MKNKLLSIYGELAKIKTTLRYTVLMLISFVAYYLYRLHTTAVISSGQTLGQIDTIVYFLLAVVPVSCVILIL